MLFVASEPKEASVADEAGIDDNLRFEKEKFAAELALKREELELKKADVERQSRFWNQFSPVALALFATFIGLIGNLVVTFIQGRNNAEIESRKSQAAMIAEAIKTGDEAKAKRNLLFFLDAGLITDPDGRIRTALQQPSGTPVLPSGVDALLARREAEEVSHLIDDLVARGDIYVSEKQFDNAKRDYERAITLLQPHDPRRKTIEAKLGTAAAAVGAGIGGGEGKPRAAPQR
jgi:hypothetical protein